MRLLGNGTNETPYVLRSKPVALILAADLCTVYGVCPKVPWCLLWNL